MLFTSGTVRVIIATNCELLISQSSQLLHCFPAGGQVTLKDVMRFFSGTKDLQGVGLEGETMILWISDGYQ